MTRLFPGGRLVRNALLVVLATVLAGAIAVPSGSATLAGSQGTDTSLPKTDSAVTVSGRDQFANLQVTVNQTKHLLNQAISVTWTGGTPTLSGAGGRFFSDYVQIMECWGDDDGTVPGNPGPPPEQCVQGATNAAYGGAPGSLFPSGSWAPERLIAHTTWPNFDSSAGVVGPGTINVWRPFRSVDGTVVGAPYDPKFDPSIVGGNYWLNPYFNIVTTNEIPATATGPNGTGAELFEVNTGLESSGLGCGQAVQPVPGGAPKVPRCWVVVVPRGSATNEDAGTPFASTAALRGVMTSPLSPAAWQHRIAIPLEFNPVDSACSLAAQQRRISGSELPAAAIANWQPKLCAVRGLLPYVYGVVGDSQARGQLLSNLPGTPGLVAVSKPIDPAQIDPSHPVVYAPLTLSALVVGFNVERNPTPSAEPAAQALAGVRIAQLNLTPRLLAKLLTQSYQAEVAIKSTPPYPWLAKNPAHMGQDPDFLRFNPEFSELQIAAGKNFGGFVLPSGTSDAASQLWQYVLADPEARMWLDGTPDPWGMMVNPVYATKAAANSSGAAFGAPLPDSFPKSDPYCYQAPKTGPNQSITPQPLCGTDWLPYVGSLHAAAEETRRADDGAKTVENPFAISADQYYQRALPQTIGTKVMLSISDSPSAALYGVQEAHLSRAGDDGSVRTFVPPTAASLTAAVQAMRPSALDPSVLEPDPAAHVPTAYPLTTLTYAAAAPTTLDAAGRRQYGAFVAYAAGDGQVPGQLFGQLPPGYAPLPASLRAEAAAAAKLIAAAAPPVSAGPSALPTPSTTTSVPRSASNRPSIQQAKGVATQARIQEAAPSSPDASFASPVESPTSSRSSPSGSALSTPVATSATIAPTAVAPEPAPLGARAITPAVAVPGTRFFLPGVAALSLLAALGALEITKRPRRASTTTVPAEFPVRAR